MDANSRLLCPSSLDYLLFKRVGDDGWLLNYNNTLTYREDQSTRNRADARWVSNTSILPQPQLDEYLGRRKGLAQGLDRHNDSFTRTSWFVQVVRMILTYLTYLG